MTLLLEFFCFFVTVANKYNYMNLIVCRSSSSNSSNMASALHESLSSFFVLFPSFLMYSIVYASNEFQRIHSLSFHMNHHIEMFCSLDLCTYTYIYIAKIFQMNIFVSHLLGGTHTVTTAKTFQYNAITGVRRCGWLVSIGEMKEYCCCFYWNLINKKNEKSKTLSKNDWKFAKNVWNDRIAKLIFTESSHKRYHASNAWTDSDTMRRKLQRKCLTTNCS